MEELYKDYFQKSKVFLYPILGFNKTSYPRVFETYIAWKDYIKINDCKLICIFKKDDSEKWLNFEINHLITHPLLIESIVIDKNKIAYIFDLSIPEYQEDFNIFLKGEYSKLSNNVKRKISKYFGTHTPEWVYVESFIHPSKYFKKYSELLKIDVDLLKEKGELCSFYDIKQETCNFKINY